MRKLLALTLSLLMVFSLVPVAMVSAEGETYLTMFDASSETASSQIGSGNIGGKVTIVDLENEEHPKAFYLKRTNEWNGFAGAFTGDIRSVAKGVIGIRFWVAGDAATVAAGQKFSAGIGTDSKYYKSTSDVNNNFGPLTSEGAYYTWMLNTGNVYVNRGTFQGHYEATAAKTAITEKFLAIAKTRIFLGTGQYGNTEKLNGYQAGLYVDDIELIYPAGVTPAPIEFTATFAGTETAVLTEEVASVKSDVANNDAVVMPEATLAEGEFAGWALNGDFTKLYAPGEVVNISGNVTFYAVNANKPALATPAAPIADTVNGSTVALKAVTGAVYSKDGATWQDSNVFSGLTGGATYTFYQKMSETLTHAESAVSQGLTVTTPVSFKWNLYSDNFTITENTTPAKFNTQYSGDGTYFFGTGLKAGQTVTFVSLANLQPGVYSANLWARTTGSRAPIDVEINGVKVKSALNTGTNKGYDASFALDEATVEILEEGPITLKLTATGTGGLYLNSLEIIKVADVDLGTTRKVKIDGEVVAEVELGSEYTIPTPPTGYCYTDGETVYYGGEQVVVEKYLNLTSEVLTTKVVYTMDEGSRIVSGYTQACTPGDGVFEEVSGDWVFKLPSKGDQQLNFTLPIDWFEKPYYKATSISFSISKTSGAAGNTDFVRFTDGKEYVSISEGYTSMLSKYTVDVDESLYGYRTFKIRLKGGSNFVEAKDYIYIDDVTVNFEYDFNYVAPTTYDVTIDGEVVASVEEGSTFTLPALEAGKYYVGYEGVTEIVVTEALNLTTATYTYDITIDGTVVATVEHGTEYTLPALDAGKYYVDVTETTFVVTSALSFTTATYTFDITIDGTVVATVAYGETFTLPAVAEGMQYVDGFVAGQEFTVTEALAFATEKIPEIAGETTTVVSTDAAASIRLNEKNGIRFYTQIDEAALAALVGDKEYEIGTLIGPKNLVGDYLTVEDEAAENAVKVTYDMENGLYEEDEFKGVVGSMVNIKESNIARDFVARAYVLVDGVYYYSESQSVRSLAYVANEFVKDTDNFAKLDTVTKALVEAWASKFNG